MTFQSFITEPVGILITSVLISQSFVVILIIIDEGNEALHRIPVFLDDGEISVLLPDCPWNDYSGICPSQTHSLISILSIWCNAWKTTPLALAVTHVTHPFMKECGCICKEGSGFSKHLSISCPSKSFISLRAICRDRKIVGIHSPDSIGYEFVHQFVACCDASGLMLSLDGCHRHRNDRLDGYRGCCRD